MANRVTCINKQDRDNPYESITHIGGYTDSKDSYFRITQDKAISQIESGKYRFYVNVDGDQVDVIVAKSRFGNKYLKTEADGDLPNNLLSLAECPISGR